MSISSEFKDKCYICEQRYPTSINIEHFIPHRDHNNFLKCDWDNLFFACFHYNNIKGHKYTNLLKCTNSNDNVASELEYIFEFFPVYKVKIRVQNDREKVKNTKNLLTSVYNGTTIQKQLEAKYIRNGIGDELIEIQGLLTQYFSSISDEEKPALESKIIYHLSNESSFTAFKHWIIRNDPKYLRKFSEYVE